MQSLNELVLTVYHCPINQSVERGGLNSEAGYLIFGNLNEVIKKIKRGKYEVYDKEFILKKDPRSSELYKCPRIGKEEFYDPRTQRIFLTSL